MRRTAALACLLFSSILVTQDFPMVIYRGRLGVDAAGKRGWAEPDPAEVERRRAALADQLKPARADEQRWRRQGDAVVFI